MAEMRPRGIRLPDSQWALLEALAAQHERSLSWAVSAAVRMSLERRPGVPTDPDAHIVHVVGEEKEE